MKTIEANGAKIPALGFGTYRLEGRSCVDMVQAAIDAGYRHIDTARMYGNEAEVGEGIRKSGIARDELFVTTKVWWDHIDQAKLVPSAREAIEAIGIGPVDLLLIHWPNNDVALEESIGALNKAKDEGLTRHIGLANYPSATLDEAVHLSAAPLACNQVEYHPFLSQETVLSACRRHGMALVAYCPIGQGKDLLADETIGRIAERHGRTPAQIALRWEIEQDGVAAIPSTSKPERAAENIAVFDFELSDEDRAEIEALSRQRKRLVDPDFAPVWDAA